MPAVCPETSHIVKMLGLIQQWDLPSGCHTDNTDKYLFLMLLKLGMDVVVLLLCCRKQFTSFLSVCSLSIILADLVLVFSLATLWCFGSERYLVSLCFLLANASATYGALPLPMMCLGLVDYWFQDTYLGNQSAFCKILRNVVLTSLVWMLAVIHPFTSVNTDLMEMDFETGIKALVCEVGESLLVTFFTLGLFTAVVCAMVPFWTEIPQWMKEAQKLSKTREEPENRSSDLLFTSTDCADTKSGEENHLETIHPSPPLWLSLTLGFGVFWIPYLAVSVACLIAGFAVPAYITVNLLWFECTNSLLLGAVFWAKSKTQGPYSRLPDNVCLWHVFWHLSKGTQQDKLSIAVLSPSKEQRKTLLCV